jgi:hypothetical protein
MAGTVTITDLLRSMGGIESPRAELALVSYSATPPARRGDHFEPD